MKILKTVLVVMLAIAIGYLEITFFKVSDFWRDAPTQKIVAETVAPIIILSVAYTILAVVLAGRIKSSIKAPDPLPETKAKNINLVINGIVWPVLWYKIFLRPSLLVGLPLYLVIPKVACFVLLCVVALLNSGMVVYRIINRKLKNG